jgi:cytidine deaminase
MPKTNEMEFSSIIAKAQQLARPISTSEDCRAGDVACVIVAVSGHEFTGVCVEFECGIGFCAEHAAVAEMLKNGESQIKLVVAVNKLGEVMPPCGRCREMMWQLNNANRQALVILSVSEARPLTELLPFR